MSSKGNWVTFPLTHPQKRIWYEENIYSDSAIFNIGGALRIKGKIDLEVLERAINMVIEKHEAFRLRFIISNDELCQYISKYKFIILPKINFSNEEEFINWANNEFKKGFNLHSGPLYQCVLCTNGGNESYVYLKMHHIISDGWAFNIFVKSICEIYNRLIYEEDIDISVNYSYKEVVKSEGEYLNSKRYIDDKNYYIDKFTNLPEDLTIEKESHVEGRRKVYKLEIEESKKVKSFVKEHSISINTFFVSIYLIYMNKKYQQEDIIIGSPILNRFGKKERSIIGMFTSTMPFRYKVNVEMTFEEMMHKVNSELIKSFRHQKYPYDLLVQDLELRKHSYRGLFHTCINTYNTNFGYEMGGKKTEVYEFYCGRQAYSLQLIIKDWEDDERLVVAFDYKTSEYTPEDIEAMFIHLSNIMKKVLDSPMGIIKKMDLLSEENKLEILLNFNSTQADYPKKETIYELFEKQVGKTPNSIAISFENQKLTYTELNKRSNQLARRLRERGVNNSSKIGIMTKHSLETIVGILAIIKAGAAYVPIDAAYPTNRMKYIIDDSDISIILANYDVMRELEFKGEYINLKNKEFYTGEDKNLEKVNEINDLVYVIYTSGSTGNPKGVMIEHKGLTNYICWAKKTYIKDNDEIFALYSSLSFDLTVTSIFTPLISGNRINIYYDDGSEFILYKILKENEVNILKLTPAHLALLQERDYSKSSVKKFIVGGENLKCELAVKIYETFNGGVEIFNEYGPTETVVGCMIHKFNYNYDIEGSVPIGVPADNVNIYLLDKYLNPVPYEIVGEIYISGDGVARGYLGNNELTDKVFISNPFIQGEIMYKTGDNAKRRKDGKLEYIGRIDKQVKIRGHRIELGEIRKRLLDINYIREAEVIDYDEVNGEKKLCAFIVASENTDSKYIKNELKKSLPSYMLPAHIVFLDRFPLTVNGKVDTKKLVVPENDKFGSSEKVKPRNEMEAILIDVTEDILGIKGIGINENFYELGGDSIKAIQISSRLNNIQLGLKVKDILTYDSLEEIAACIEVKKNVTADQNHCSGELDNTPIMQWFFDQNFTDFNHWNQSILLKINSEISTDMIDTALKKLIEHHDSLRINYNVKTGKLYYNNLCDMPQVKVVNIANLSYIEQQNRIKDEGEKLKASLNIKNTVLFKACIFQLGVNGSRLLLTAHHLITDGVSWRIMIEDFSNLLKQQVNGLELKLPLKTHSVRAWVEELKKYSDSISESENIYWNEVIEKQRTFKEDYDLGSDTLESLETLNAILEEQETKSLLTLGNDVYGVSINEILIIALAIGLRKVFEKSEFTMELESHGREEISNQINVSRTVGWFTSMYPVNLSIEGEELGSQIKSIKEQLRTIPNNGFDYGILKYISKKIKQSPKKLIRFNYLGDFSAILDEEMFSFVYEETGVECSGRNQRTSLIEVIAMINNNKLRISLNYSKNKFRKRTIQNLLDKLLFCIRKIDENCRNKDSREFTPSDFEDVDILQEDLDMLFR